MKTSWYYSNKKVLVLLRDYGYFNFRNVFHYLYWENSTELVQTYFRNQSMPYLLTQMKLRRLSVAQNHGQRSKYITRPNYVINPGNHAVWKMISGKHRIFNAKSKKKTISRFFPRNWMGKRCLSQTLWRQ